MSAPRRENRVTHPFSSGPEKWCLTLFFFAAAAHGTAAVAADAPSPVEVRAAASPESPTIGSHIRYEVTVTAPPGIEILVAQPAERIGDLEIVDFGQAESSPTADGKVAVKRWWSLVGWSPGAHVVASPEVSYRMPGGELTPAPAAETVITIASVLDRAKDVTDIRDIKPPVPIPVDRRPYYALAAIFAIVAAAVAIARLLARRRKRAIAAPPPVPADVIALGALDALRARRLLESGALKEYYSTLTDIVRTYLEGRYRVRAPEMTTEEFLLASARDGRLGTGHRRLLGDFLGESDLVKFARHQPSNEDGERAYTAARRFVEDTRERMETSENAAR